MTAWRSVRSLPVSPAAKQAVGLASASLVANALAVVSTAILTRNLGTNQFGTYSLAASLLMYVALFFDFGIFSPAARLVATTEVNERRAVVGAALLAYLPVGIAFSATVFGLSFGVDSVFNATPGHALLIAALPAIALPFIPILQGLAQALGRLHVASAGVVVSQLMIVIFVVVAVLIDALSAPNALAFRSLAQFLTMLAAVLWLRPVFRGARYWIRMMLRGAREWGVQAFLGRILSIGTYNMDVLMLGIWANSRSVGFYALAASLAAASGLPVEAMGPALFAQMARAAAIARRWLLIAAVVGSACAILAWAVAEPAIRIFFSARYVPAASLVLPLALAQFTRGVTGIFNSFMNAHGKGKDLRNTGLILTVSNLTLNFILIPPFGASGAAWASLLALVINLAGYFFYYLRSYHL
jgi:O-antigen/teichoic acid export membrane protein